MTSLRFKPEDFPCHFDCQDTGYHSVRCQAKESAQIANERLAEMLKDARVIFLIEAGGIRSNFIEADDQQSATHQARLVEIERVK